MQTRERIEISRLPLAVYRELAAHLGQVENVQVELIPQTSEQFDYNSSQVEGLWISFATNASNGSRNQVKQILEYYQTRYGK